MEDNQGTAKKLLNLYIKRKLIKHTAFACVIFFMGFLLLMPILTFFTASKSQRGQGYENVIDRMLEIALAEVGTVGGDKYSTWYHGRPTGLAWCSIFVSWCAGQVGLIEQGIIPKEQLCFSGIKWFKERGRFKYTTHYGGEDYIPQKGDIIYFTWDGGVDPMNGHVGIVYFVEGDNVITVEGNTNNNRCAIRVRNRKSDTVLGYGVPDYASAQGMYGEADFSGNSTAEIVWNFLKSKGCSDEAAAGIMGNIQQESSMNPAAIENKGKGKGHGLCQWTDGRKDRLFQRASDAGKLWQDIEVQLTLMWDELNGLDSTTKNIMNKNYGGLQNFMQTTNVSWAVEAFEKSFERAGDPMLARRIVYANRYYNMFAG